MVSLDHDSSPVLRDLGNGLLVSYVVDQGDHFAFITERDAASDGLTHDQLHAIGLGNLAGALGTHGLQVHPYGPIFAVIAGGNFEASVLLLDDIWDRGFRQFVSGTYAVAVPARDILAFGDSQAPDARAHLRAVIERAGADADHRLSDKLYIRTGTAWAVADEPL